MIIALALLCLFASSILIAAVALPRLEHQARESGMVDTPGQRKDHPAPIPPMGGIAILLAVAIPAVAGLLIALFQDAAGSIVDPRLALHLPGLRAKAPELLTILMGAGVMMLMGHLDDRRGLSPWLRLGIQSLCAFVVAQMGMRITLHLPEPWMHTALTVIFIVFIINAVNFIDNMNGLCAGSCSIIGLHMLCLALATGQLFMAAILTCLIGGLFVFLARNFPQAKVFLGDAGSMALGFLVATLVIALTFEEGMQSARPWLMPLLILIVPIADGATVIVTRLARGVHPFTPGQDHLSHRLTRRGLSRHQAVLGLWGIGAAAGFVALAIAPLSWRDVIPTWIVGAGYLLWLSTRRGSPAATPAHQG